MSILTLAGSPSNRSRSSALLRHAADRLAQRGQVIREAGLRDIPAEDLIEGRYTSHAAADLRRRVEAADVLLVSTPVYKASFAGGLKAVLDLLDERSLADKIVLPIATGGSPAHLLALEYSLKPVLSALGARHILAGVYATDKQVHFSEDGQTVIDDEVRQRLDDAVDRVVRHLAPAAPAHQAVDLGRLVANGQLGI
ncbi:NADPH-dependent FMN reductase [Bordetella genomosp. 13]|uniref:NADPH-dependent FMN reductase n=1 Tax=Bordetella genomosp. 13 TaxID=463040 RepID=UPI00119E0391|nr:NADPH-dependent FMN reductase [Bordetella genomosp. 13]